MSSDFRDIKVAIEPADPGLLLTDVEGVLAGALNIYVRQPANAVNATMRAIDYLFQRNHPTREVDAIQCLDDKAEPMVFRVYVTEVALLDENGDCHVP